MKTNRENNWKVILAVLGVTLLAVGTISGISVACGCNDEEEAPIVQRPVVVNRPVVVAAPAPVQVYQPAPQPVYVNTTRRYTPAPAACAPCAVARSVARPVSRIIPETRTIEEDVTTYETTWDEETRYREKTVTRQVPETTVRQETYTVSRPVWETIEKEVAHDVVRYVPETSEKEEVQMVSRPVTEYKERQITETVNRPVTETVMQQRSYTVNRAVTSYQTQVRDRGQYVTQYIPQPQKTYNRLAWQRADEYVDPATGTTKRHVPGLYWKEMHTDPEYKAQRVWQPNLVSEQVQVTNYIPETVTEEVPVNVQKVIQEQVTRTETVPVTTMVTEQVVKKIPVTTYKQVNERVVEKVPQRVCRTVTEEKVREIPTTTYKPVTEVVREPYTVKVPRQVATVKKVPRQETYYMKYPVCDRCANASKPCAECAAHGVEVHKDGTPILRETVTPTLAEPANETTLSSETTLKQELPTASQAPTVLPSPATNNSSSSDSRRYPGPVETSDSTVISTEDTHSTAPTTPLADSKTYSATDKSAKEPVKVAQNQTQNQNSTQNQKSNEVQVQVARPETSVLSPSSNVNVQAPPLPPAPNLDSEKSTSSTTEEKKNPSQFTTADYTLYTAGDTLAETVQSDSLMVSPTKIQQERQK